MPASTLTQPAAPPFPGGWGGTLPLGAATESLPAVLPTQTVRELRTVDAPAAPVSPAMQFVMMLERLASNPNVDTTKLEKLIDLQERVLDRNAEAAFNDAFSAMQAAIPVIAEKGAIKDRNGAVQSRYALNEDIQDAVRPVLQAHGFGLSFRTEWPEPGIIEIVGILTHRDGHKRESRFRSAADKSGSKNDIQSLGSTVSYGRRYTTMDLLNITSRGQDDDGQKGGAPAKPPAPDGFEAWWQHMLKLATKGFSAVEPAWETTDGRIKTYVINYYRVEWAALKQHAVDVDRQATVGNRRVQK